MDVLISVKTETRKEVVEEVKVRPRSRSRPRSLFGSWTASDEHTELARRGSDPILSNPDKNPDEVRAKPPRRGRFKNKDGKNNDRSKSLDRLAFLRRTDSDPLKTSATGTPNIRESDSDIDFSDHKTEPRSEGKLSKWFDDIADVFSGTEVLTEANVTTEVAELKIKTLKDNILRFSNVIDPLATVAEWFVHLKSWRNPFLSFTFLSVYCYAIISGWFISFVLASLCVLFLVTFFYHHRLRRDSELGITNEECHRERSHTVAEKVVIILGIARKVQNSLGVICDSSEKIKNLLLWEHPTTRSVFALLLALFTVSTVVPSILILKIFGISLGLKMFLIDYLFHRFPKLRARFDTSSHFWDSLPTDADLLRERREGQANGEISSRPFWQVFRLPQTEKPLEYWTNGIRCSLLRRDRSVTSAFKTGRLFVTNRHLCFERSKSHPEKNIVIPLGGIDRIEKGNQYPWIPGGGMVIEITTKVPEKVFTFGAVSNRDEVFQELENILTALPGFLSRTAVEHGSNRQEKNGNPAQDSSKKNV